MPLYEDLEKTHKRFEEIFGIEGKGLVDPFWSVIMEHYVLNLPKFKKWLKGKGWDEGESWERYVEKRWGTEGKEFIEGLFFMAYDFGKDK